MYHSMAEYFPLNSRWCPSKHILFVECLTSPVHETLCYVKTYLYHVYLDMFIRLMDYCIIRPSVYFDRGWCYILW